jgi:hypothetical protein
MSAPIRRVVLTAAIAASSLAALGGIALAAIGISTYLLRSGEQTGFTVTGRPLVARTVAASVRDLQLKGRQAKTFTQLLTAGGFTGDAEEHLVASGGRQGFSLVAAFHRPGGPARVRDYLLGNAERDQSGRVTRFAIPGVPSARGVTAVEGVLATSNVYWTEGRCVFGSGLFLPRASGLSVAAINAPVIAGLRAQRARTHRRCA